MKKRNQIIGVTLILCMLITMVFPFTKVYAVASASLKVSKRTIYVGESTKITASVNTSEVWNLSVTSNGGSLSGTTQDADAPGSEVSKQVISCSFTANVAGTYTITLKGTVASTDDVNNQKIQTVSKTVTITVKNKEQTPPVTPPSGGDDNNQDIPQETNPGTTTPTTPTKSSNNYLSSLKVNEGTLSPEFSFRTYNYTVNVGEEVNSIKVTAKAEHNKATVSGTGTKKLKPGENKIDITVKAEDGKERTYTITVNKPTEEIKAGLKSLLVKGVMEDGETIELSYAPEFFSEIYEYQMLLDETLSNITKLDIEAIGLQEDFTIEITGNEELKEGENTITITVKSKDGKTTATYTIVVIKEAKVEEVSAPVEAEKEEEKPLWNTTQKIVITVVTSIIAIMGIVFAVIEYRYQKTHKEEKEENRNEEVEEVAYSGIDLEHGEAEENEVGDMPFATIGFENETDKTDALKEESGAKFQEIAEQTNEVEEELKKQAKSRKGKHF